jgi:HlyD family secretion protein
MANLSFSRQILPALAVLCILVSAIFVARSQPDRALAQVTETPAQVPPEQKGGTVAGAGVVEPSSELIEIGAFLPGVVERVHVRAGDQVVAGQPLFSIDSRDARATLAEAEARVERLRASVAAAQTSASIARRQLGLYGDVNDDRAISRQEVIERQGNAQTADAQLAVARAEMREAQAQLQSARVTLDRLTVRAPSAAQVLQVRTREGQYATAGPAPGNSSEPLMTLGVTRPLHVRVDIDENEIDRTAIGRDAVISPRGNAAARVTARFVRAEPLVVPKRSLTNASTERVDIRVLQLIYALPEQGHRLFVGQQVDAFVPARTSGTGKKAAGR